MQTEFVINKELPPNARLNLKGLLVTVLWAIGPVAFTLASAVPFIVMQLYDVTFPKVFTRYVSSETLLMFHFVVFVGSSATGYAIFVLFFPGIQNFLRKGFMIKQPYPPLPNSFRCIIFRKPRLFKGVWRNILIFSHGGDDIGCFL